MKALCAIFVLSLSFFFIQCTDTPVSPAAGELSHEKKGGGHTSTVNNLSFPVLLADNFSITSIADTLFTVIYEGPYTDLTQEQYDYVQVNGPWYAQKVEGNTWQAQYLAVPNVNATFVDWGDAMESVDPKINRPYRIEFGLYTELTEPMKAYKMTELAFPSSLNETQGTNQLIYDSYYATIATPKAKLVVQKYDEGAVLTWNGSSWDGAYNPESGFGFAPELNVGGKYIFGASTGGWRPTSLGEYRITLYFEAGTTVNLVTAQPGDYNAGTPVIPKIGENNTAIIDAVNNITYLDVTVVPGGGGGGGH